MQSENEGVMTRSKARSEQAGEQTELSFDSLSQSLKDELLKTIKDAVHESLGEIVNDIKSRVSSIEERMDELENQLSHLQSQLNLIGAKANDNEQYSRRHNVRITGFPEEKGEDCVAKVAKFCKETMKIAISSADIDRAHRVGKPSQSKHRAIIVRLQSHRHKLDIMKNKKQLRGTKFFVNEDLTKENQKLFSEARKLPKVKSAWTRDGTIFIKDRDSDKIYRIDSSLDIFSYNLQSSPFGHAVPNNMPE